VSGKLAQAQVRIAQLQSTVHDLKAALRDSTAMSHARQAQSESETIVDKRLAAALVVAFLSLQRQSGRTGFGSLKSRDALNVLTSVLGLSPEEKAAVGLKDSVDGQPDGGGGGLMNSAVGAVGGFLGSFLSSPAPSCSRGDGSDGEVPDSLGSAFVQFLLEETSDPAQNDTAPQAETRKQESETVKTATPRGAEAV
jgi:hypothetical protein